MGCASSKRVEATVDVYRPSATSFAVFDINSVQEPWVTGAGDGDEETNHDGEKPTHVPAPILEKLNTFELVSNPPHSWSELSQALEDLKPSLHSPITKPKPEPTTPPAQDSSPMGRPICRKSFSFHTLEELEVKVKQSSNKTDERRTESTRAVQLRKTESSRRVGESTTDSNGFRSVKENMFLVRDRVEREKEGKEKDFTARWNPLRDFPEKCPPGGDDAVVVYTTTLQGVRRTYEDCNKVRLLLEGHRVVFDERDISLHGEFRSELKELLGEGVNVPRVFVKGRYLGGVDEVLHINETGRLGRILNSARVERGLGRLGCEGCGGARFVPCLNCGGSCKVVVPSEGGAVKERCPNCNENGLVHCPTCH